MTSQLSGADTGWEEQGLISPFTLCLVKWFVHCCDKHPREETQREEAFVLAIGGPDSLDSGPTVRGNHADGSLWHRLPTSGRAAIRDKNGRDARYPKHLPQEVTFCSEALLPEVLAPPRTAPPAGDPPFSIEAIRGDITYSSHNFPLYISEVFP